jgi:hypothetical protein
MRKAAIRQSPTERRGETCRAQNLRLDVGQTPLPCSLLSWSRRIQNLGRHPYQFDEVLKLTDWSTTGFSSVSTAYTRCGTMPSVSWITGRTSREPHGDQ